MEVQRLVLFIALALVLLLLWQEWIEFSTPPPVAGPAVGESLAPEPAADVPPPVDVPALPTPAPAPAPALAPAQVADAPAVGPTPQSADRALDSRQRVVVETDVIRAEIDTLGGDLRTVDLKRYPVAVDRPDQPLRLMSDSPQGLFVAQSGLIGRGHEFPTHRTVYEAGGTHYELAAGAGSVEVPLTWTAPDGVRYRKVYVLHRDSYLVDIRFEVDNGSTQPWAGYLYGQYARTPIAETRSFLFGGLPSYTGGAIYTPEEKYEKVDFDEMAKSPLARETASGWVAMLQHYFVSAWLPAADNRLQFYSSVDDRSAQVPRYYLGFKTLQPTGVEPGASGVLKTRLFVGPKEQDRLEQPAEGLILTVDYGWLTPVASPLFWILDHIHSVVGNWGWAIILLTLLVKLVFFPLSAASYKSMAKMKKLQPRMQTLKERYGDDRQKFQQAMMEIYKEEKINPLGGCLPIVIQIPVFIALYWVLLESVELRQAEFALWLRDLSVPDPYFVLPILMGASMFGQQLLNPQPVDKVQRNIMMALPVVFTFFFLWFPAGLVLYWLVNNVLSIAQQWFITNKIAAAKG